MANRFPLIVDTNIIKELALGDNLDLTGSAIVNGDWRGNAIPVANISGLGSLATASSVANTQITGNIIASQLQPTGVTAGVYGNATIIPVVTVDVQEVVNTNCVYDYDLVKENVLYTGSKIVSNQVIFSNKILK